jgi:hypothetical protein
MAGCLPVFLALRACCYAEMIGTISIVANRFLNTVSPGRTRDRESGVEVQADRVRQGSAVGAPSCCTCCLAMLAKPRF